MIINGKTLDEHADEEAGRNPLTHEEMEAAIKAMQEAGRKAGKNDAGWLLDGNSSKETAAALLEQIENCELDTPARGEGDPTTNELIDEHTEWDAESLEEGERDVLSLAYDDEYAEGFQEEAERIARLYSRRTA